MGKARARAYAACLLCLGTALGFFLLAIARVPLLLYYPLSRRFTWATPVLGPDELSMDFFGRSLYALLLGAALAVGGYAIARRAPNRARPAGAAVDRRLTLIALYALTLVLLAAGLYGYQLATRAPTPEPLPAWYVPR